MILEALVDCRAHSQQNETITNTLSIHTTLQNSIIISDDDRQ